MSPTHTVLVEQSVIGWKEYELEVMRDAKDNVVIICSIENFDAMGVHTGDSITVAPAQTLTDKEYQRMRDAAIGVIREVGVETGGSNIQFAVEPGTGRMVGDRDEPARVALLGARLESDGLPDRADRGEARGRATRSTRSRTTSRARPRSAFEPTLDYVV
jgi:carbamoyl-phosphate synthase large subunit